MMKNEMCLEFDSISANEAFARVTVAAFMTQMNPSMEEVADVKTAVSEAVTNAIIHGYEGEVHKIVIRGRIDGEWLELSVEDRGVGIADVEKAMEPLYTTRTELERSGMGFLFMEAFMDEVKVESEPGKGTAVMMKKRIGQRGEYTMDRTEELIRRSQDGDNAARETLIEENLGLIHHVVKRFLGRGVEAEDLFQIGAVGLVKAVDRFDLSFGVRFSTYAVPMIAGEIKRFLRDDSMIKVSRSLKELAVKAARLREQLLMERGEEPGVDELARRLKVEPEELVQAMDSSIEVESLQKVICQGSSEGVSLMERVEQGHDEQEELLRRMLLEELLSSLEPRERRLIVLRFFYDRTQTQVSRELGLSQVQVSRLEKKILYSMK